TRYYVIIPAVAIETTTGTPFSGVTLKDDWDFTTVTLPPSVIAYDPDGLTAVAVDKVLNLTFDRPIKFNESGIHTIRIGRNSDASTFYTYYINGLDTDELLSVSGNVLSIIPPVNFESSTQYYVEISDGAILSLADMSFPGISGTTTWTFTSVVAAAPPVVDTGGYSPVTGSIEISRNPVLELTFNENIVKGSFGYLRIFTSEDDEEIFLIPRSQAIVVDNKLSVPLTNITLQYGRQYYIGIDAGYVKSSTSGVYYGGISGSTEWYFTTETAPPAWADGYPNISNQTVEDFKLDVWADVTGAFYGVLTQSSTQPTAEQIAQGQNSGGSAARIAFNQVVNSIETFSSIGVAFNDQTLLGQSYFLHLVYRSGGTYPKYGEIKTIEIDRIIPTVEKTYPANNSMVFPAPDAIEITFSELVVGTNGEALSDAYFSLVQNSDPEVPIPFVISIVADGERTVITLTPTGGLVDNTAYTLTIKTVYDLSGNSSAASTIYFETDGIAQWTGTHDSNWNEPDNWGGTLPVDGKSVLIPGSLTNYPLITSETINVHNLTIAPGAVLSHSGGTLNVSGLFHLQSSSDVNASYINTGGILNATADSIRVDQVISNIDLTYIISSPTNSSTAANFGAYFPLYRYDNPTDTWEAISSAMTPGVGYRMWTDDTMVSFTGSFNAGNIGVSLLRTDGQGYGWNFVGNPYPASIDWTELNITEASSVENAFWMWLPTSRSYGSFSAATNIPINISSSIIPSNHGFLVKVKKELGSGSITFSPGAQVGNSTSYLKSASTREVAPHFKLAGVSSSFCDELAIAFVDESSLDLDKFDMEKKFAERKNIFELYSISGESKSVINAFPSADKIEIPLGYNALQKGDYSIEMLSNSEDNANVVLVDKLLDVETNLTVGSKYDFTINETGKNSTRFTLKIEKVLTSNQEIKDADNSKAVTVFANDGEIFVNQISAGVFNRYSIVDVQGRLVKEGVLSSAIGSKALGAFDKGLYIVSFSNGKDKNVMNSKVVVY
ncbi:MAG: Ig-like domain-containing protein, partial [Bacteroidales bacterium]|nr:Ig-like domain-containing protein [Bacteroidales bacterium]